MNYNLTRVTSFSFINLQQQQFSHFIFYLNSLAQQHFYAHLKSTNTIKNKPVNIFTIHNTFKSMPYMINCGAKTTMWSHVNVKLSIFTKDYTAFSSFNKQRLWLFLSAPFIKYVHLYSLTDEDLTDMWSCSLLSFALNTSKSICMLCEF